MSSTLEPLAALDAPRGSGDSRTEDRAAVLRDLHAQGLTLQEIGERLEPAVTREAVRQMLGRLGLSVGGRPERRAEWLLRTRGQEIQDEFLRCCDDRATAKALGLAQAEVKNVVDRLIPDVAVLRKGHRIRQQIYSDADLIDCLQAATEVLTQPLSHNAYDRWAKKSFMDDGRPRPRCRTIMKRWELWSIALVNAGLEARPKGERGFEGELSREVVVAAVAECWRELGEPPDVKAYDAWSKGNDARPSESSVRGFVYGWDDAQISAWQIIHPTLKLNRDDLPGLACSELGSARDTCAKNVEVGDDQMPETTEGDAGFWQPFYEMDENPQAADLQMWEPGPGKRHAAGDRDSGKLEGTAAPPKTGRIRRTSSLAEGAFWQPYREANENARPAEAQLARADPEKVRAAFQGHARLQSSIAAALRNAGLEPHSAVGEPEFDLAWRRRDQKLMLCEIKSVKFDTLESQMRAAVAQALRYQAQLEDRAREPVVAAIFIEKEPDEIWRSLCERLEIVLAWPPYAKRLIQPS